MENFKTIKDLVYIKRDSCDLSLDLHLPTSSNAPFPVILGLSGGGWRNCSKESVPTFLANHGFAMVCITYRVSSDAIAPANIHDCKAALHWIHQNSNQYGFDLDRIGVYGASAGGHLATLLGLSDGIDEFEYDEHNRFIPSLALHAICSICAPMDLVRYGKPEMKNKFPELVDPIEQYLGAPISEREELARLLSPLNYVSTNSPPIFLAHGTSDTLVPDEETTLFHDAMQNVNAECSIKLIQGAGHGWLVEDTKEDITSFFKSVLDH